MNDTLTYYKMDPDVKALIQITDIIAGGVMSFAILDITAFGNELLSGVDIVVKISATVIAGIYYYSMRKYRKKVDKEILKGHEWDNKIKEEQFEKLERENNKNEENGKI